MDITIRVQGGEYYLYIGGALELVSESKEEILAAVVGCLS